MLSLSSGLSTTDHILLISVYFSRGTRRTSAMKQPCARCLFQTASLLYGLGFYLVAYFCICCFKLCSFVLLLLTQALCRRPFSRIKFQTSLLTGNKKLIIRYSECKTIYHFRCNELTSSRYIDNDRVVQPCVSVHLVGLYNQLGKVVVFDGNRFWI